MYKKEKLIESERANMGFFKLIVKWFYKKLIIKSIIIDRNHIRDKDRLKKFLELELNTNFGKLAVVFTEDRHTSEFNGTFLNIMNFFVFIENIDNIDIKKKELIEKGVLIVKLYIFKINYEWLAEVLLEYYLDNMINYIEYNSKNKE
jgi:hypothetical protein